MTAIATHPAAADYLAAKEGRAYRVRPASILDVEGPDRVAFLHGQLTQEVRNLSAGETRPAAGLNPKGKLIFFARVQGLPDRVRLLLSAGSRGTVLRHLQKYAAFQKVSIVDRSDELLRVGLLGGIESTLNGLPALARLPADGEFSAEIVIAAARWEEIEERFRSAGLSPVSQETAEILRVESGRPRFGQDADESNFADEVGLESSISRTKGCFVGQEIVARTRTYGRVNRRLVGFRFPEGAIAAGGLLKLPQDAEPGKIEEGRVTSSVLSPAFGPIGLGYAFREVPMGATLSGIDQPFRPAIVSELPFSPARASE